MAGKGLKVVFPFTSTIDASQILSTMKQMRDIVGKEKVQIKLDVKSELGENLVDKLGGTNAFVDTVTQSATSIGKLTENIRVFKNSAGQTFNVATSQIKEFRGENGELVREVIQLKTAQEAAKEAALAGYDVLASSATVQSNFAKAVQLTEQNLNRAKEATDKGAQSTQAFMDKSKNMGGAQVKAAREAGQAFLDLATKMDWTEKDTKKLQTQFEALTNSYERFLRLRPQTEAGANVFQNFTNRITNAIKQTIAYSFSIGLVYKAQQLLNDSVRYAIDLNKEMVKIQVLQVEGARTAEDINNLAVAYNNLAQAMGASTLEVAKGSVEWLRQGRTIAETQQLLKSTLYLSKLGAMESADATNYLTAITNAFKVNANDAVTVVDKLIAVDNIAATSAGELATAMRYTSESAQLAGVSMEQLISYIGTVSTVTRQNSEMIGQAFKTMFARMTLIEGGGKDEEGWTISKVEKALKATGITVKETDGTFRNMGDVLEETARKWDSLTERERVNIAVAIAGVRQKEAFLVLMDNMDKALTYQAAQTESAGLAEQRYGIYLESVEAKQAKLNAQMQELYTKIINSDMIKGVLDLANALLEVGNATGGVLPLLTGLVGIFTLIKSGALITSAKKSLDELALTVSNFSHLSGVATKSVAGLTKAFNAMSVAIPYIGVALMAISLIWMGYNAVVDAQKKKVDEATESLTRYEDTLRGLNQRSGDLSSKIDTATVLMEKQKNGIRLTREETEELNSSMWDLYNTLPTLDWTFVDGTPQLDATRLKAIELKDELIKIAMIESGMTESKFSTVADEENKIYKEQADNIKALTARMNILQEAKTAFSSGGSTWQKFLEDLHSASAGDAVSTEWENVGERWAGRLMGSFGEAIRSGDAKNNISKIISDGIANSFTETGAAEAAQKAARARWIVLIQNAMKAEGPEAEMFLSYVDEQIAAGNTLLEESKRIANGIEEGELDLIRTRQELWDINKKVELSEYEINEIFIKQARWIDKLADGFEKYYSVINKGDSDLSDYIDSAQSILTIITELNAEGAGLEEMDITSFLAGGEFDTAAFDDYKDLLIESIEKTLELDNVTEETRLTLVSLLDELRNAGQEAVNIVEYAGDSFSLSADEFSRYTDWLATSLWNLYGEGEEAMVMTMNDGQQIVVTSAADIAQLLETMYSNFTIDIANMTSTAAANAVNLANLIGGILEGLSGKLPYFLPKPIAPAGGGGGGGGGRKEEDPRIKEIEKEVDALREQKKALEEQLDAYKDWIKVQKESLKRQKEEEDFTERLAKKHKNLGRIKAELALLELDNSEEAQKRKLELQEEAGELEEDITKDTEDRKYDLQIQALDDMQERFENNIEEQKDAIDDLIEARNKEKEAIQEAANAIGGGGGGGGGGGTSLSSAWEKARERSEDYKNKLARALIESKEKMRYHVRDLEDIRDTTGELKKPWTDITTEMDGALARARAYQEVLRRIREENEKKHDYCFLKGTKILLPDGDFKAIEDIKIGDIIVSYDIDAKTKIVTGVSETFEHIAHEIYHINGLLKVTGEHIIYINNQWIPVRKANVGDRLNLSNGEYLKIQTIDIYTGDFPVYNIHTNHATHNYFAEEILVHNVKEDDYIPNEWTGGKSAYDGTEYEETHWGGFAGNLMSNEVFSKLLEGEYTSTEVQMNNFVNTILPKIAMRMSPALREKTGRQDSDGNVNVDIEINVEGSLDEKVVPKLKFGILREINKSLEIRGARRSANRFSN